MTPILLLAISLGAPPDAHVVKLAVQPMAAPKPAMKYQLLPEVRELTPGNPVQWYMRCFAEQRNFFFTKAGNDYRMRYQKMTLAEIAREKETGFGGSALTQADWGARLDTPDWEMTTRLSTEGVELAQPELAGLRLLGESLQVRFRIEVAHKRYGEAIATAKTMLALARHLGINPTPDANLLGIDIANLLLDSLEEMYSHPGAPNLYWALTDLPVPLVDIRKGFQGQRTQVDVELRPIRDDRAMTKEEIDKIIGELSGRAAFARVKAGAAPRNLRDSLASQANDPTKIQGAHRLLVEAGLKEVSLKQFPPLQTILLNEKLAFETRRDELLTIVSTPWSDLATAVVKEKGTVNPLFIDLLPRVLEARCRQVRLEQRTAILRHVEAIRLFASEHGGKLPTTLAKVRVRLPNDPTTGKPFEYEVKDGVAHLSAGAVKGDQKVQYEITIN